MKVKAERSLKEHKDFYNGLYVDARFDVVEEAEALGVDKATASNYLSTRVDRHIPLGLAPLSLWAEQHVHWLAKQNGGAFVKICGELNGHNHDEKCALGYAVVDLFATDDPAEEERLLNEIAMNAQKALMDRAKK